MHCERSHGEKVSNGSGTKKIIFLWQASGLKHLHPSTVVSVRVAENNCQTLFLGQTSEYRKVIVKEKSIDHIWDFLSNVGYLSLQSDTLQGNMPIRPCGLCTMWPVYGEIAPRC